MTTLEAFLCVKGAEEPFYPQRRWDLQEKGFFDRGQPLLVLLGFKFSCKGKCRTCNGGGPLNTQLSILLLQSRQQNKACTLDHKYASLKKDNTVHYIKISQQNQQTTMY